jgi:hypothetical protein
MSTANEKMVDGRDLAVAVQPRELDGQQFAESDEPHEDPELGQRLVDGRHVLEGGRDH